MKPDLPFQTAGIEFIDAGGSLIADDPGLGKTRQALRAIQHREARLPALVTCPSGVQGVWATEYGLIEPGADVLRLNSKNLRELDDPKWDMVVVSADLPARNLDVFKALGELQYDTYVADEAHYFGEPDAGRTLRCMTGSQSLAARAQKTILLSGTPTQRHVGQLWPLLKATQPERLRGLDHHQFCTRFCRWKIQKLPNGREMKVPTGNNMRAVLEFKEWMKEGHPWWIRRHKRDVLPQLPPKAYRTVGLDVSSMVELDSFLKTPEGKRVAEAIRRGDMRMIEVAAGEKENHVGRLRKLIGEAKAPAAAEYIRHVILDENPRGLVVWAWHPSVLEIIAKNLGNIPYVMTTGATPSDQRIVNAAKFQGPNGPPVFLGQIVAAGIGVTLTKADRAIFVEKAWTPSRNQQAEDRIDRIGQEAGSLQIETLVLAGSIDEAVEQINETRQEEWAQLEDVTYEGE